MFTFRELKEADIPFIHSSWGKSYFEVGEFWKRMNEYEFHQLHRPIREELLKRMRVLVCVGKDNDIIMGWVGFENEELHYIYVKMAFKGLKIGSMLMKEAFQEKPIKYSHLTVVGQRIMKRKQLPYKKHKDFFAYKSLFENGLNGLK
jgi:ribosomal protein S18 acetylase RimI-like enzyme